MRIRNFKSRLFLSYLLSNVLVFLLPVAVLGWIMYQNAVVNLREEIEIATIDKLTQAKDVTESNMRELSRIAAKISFDPSLTPFMVRNDRYSSLEAIDELSRYQALNGVTEDVFLYFRGDSDIYSGVGVSGVNTFMNSFYSFSEEESTEFYELINTIDRPFIYPVRTVMFNYEPQRMLTYMFPIKELTPYGTVLFWIQESKMTGLIENTLGNFQGRAMIVQDDGAVIAESSRSSEFPTEQMLDSISGELQDGIMQTSWDGHKYSIAVVRSDAMGWKFAALMPKDQFFERVIERRTFLLYALVLVLSTGLLAALLMSMNFYRPISLLTRYARDTIGLLSDGEVRPRNELEMIRHTLDATIDRQQDLAERIEIQRPWVREITLIKLLNGGLSEPEGELLRRIAPEHAGKQLSAAFVMLMAGIDPAEGTTQEASSASSKERLMKELYQFEVPGGIGLGVELIQERSTALLVLLFDGRSEREEVRSAQRQTAQDVQDILGKIGCATPALAIGNTASGLLQVNRSFIEASAALEYALKLDRNSVVFFDEMHVLQEQSTWFPIEEQLKFVHSLKKGDEVIAVESLRTMIGSIAVQQQSLLLLKCMCIDIVNTLFKTIHELNLKAFDSDVKVLVEFSSLAVLEERASALVRRICAAVSSRKEAELESLRSQVTEYIHRLYTTYELTLESAADQFGLSPSSMSRLIKDVTGSTFTDYVSELRMQEIKRQLAETDTPIKDIIASVGYVDVSTLMRKFKRSEGVTPGEYRKLYSRTG